MTLLAILAESPAVSAIMVTVAVVCLIAIAEGLAP